MNDVVWKEYVAFVANAQTITLTLMLQLRVKSL